MSFTVLVDTVQQRMAEGGQSVSTLVQAPDWDPALSSNTYLDGVTGTMFLLPTCLESAWLTSNSGLYAKIPATSFNLTPAGSDPNWTFPTINTDNAPWMKYVHNPSGAGGGAGGILGYSVAVNQPIVIEAQVPTTTSAGSYVLAFGYGPAGDASDPIVFGVYGDFTVDVYQSGTLILGRQSVSGQISEYGQTTDQTSQQNTGQYVKFIILPCREREILVICSLGGAFSVILDSIPEGTVDATITPNVPIWWEAQPGVDCTVRMALCQFEPSGNAIGSQSFFKVDPGADPPGGFQSYLSGNTPGGTALSLLVADGINPSAPYLNGDNGVCLNVSMAGDGTYSPEVYAARGYTLPILALTVTAPGGPIDVTTFIKEASYEQSDSISGSHWNLTFKDPLGMDAAGVPGIGWMTDRPWQIYVDENLFTEGINERPEWRRATRLQTPAETTPGAPTYGDQTSANAIETVNVTVRDAMRQAENFIFDDIVPLDGLSIAQAYTLVTDLSAITDSAHGRSPLLSSSLSTSYISNAGNPTDKFNLAIQPGDKASEWMDRLVKTYCSTFAQGLQPGAGGWTQPYVLAQGDLPGLPAQVLYDSAATAIVQSVPSPTYANLFRSLDIKMLEPEANNIYVQGYDFRTGRPILSVQVDTINSDPTVAPSARTPAWRGQPILYCWNDPTLGQLGVIEDVNTLLYDRLTPARSLIEIASQFSGVLPQCALLKLYFLPGGGVPDPGSGAILNPVIIRIKTISASIVQTGADAHSISWMPTKYVGQVGLDGSNLNTHGTSLGKISQEWTLRAVSKTTQWGNPTDQPIFNRPLIQQSGP